MKVTPEQEISGSLHKSSGGLENYRITNYPTVAGSNKIAANDIVFRRRPLNINFGKPDAYILYTRSYDGTLDKNAHILAVKPDGSIDTSFDGDGIYGVDFDDPESNKEDVGIAITANAWGSPFNGGGEGIFVVAHVARKTTWGIGIYALTNRRAHPAFGNGTGSIVFGGCGVASPGGPPVGEGCRRFFDPSLVMHRPSDIEIIGDHLVVSGWAKVTGGTLYRRNGDYPMLARVHGHTGAVDQLDWFGTRNTGRNDGWFNSLVRKSNDYVVGIGWFIEDGQTRSSQLMMGLTSRDTNSIFEDSFE